MSNDEVIGNMPNFDGSVIGSDMFGNVMEVHIVNGDMVDIAVYDNFRKRISGLRLKEEYAVKMARYILGKCSKGI
ncbi:MAG: hypothetical protein K6G15_00095 [Desulfovibrio sp.]|nr:hypothetical protein [Desulfovibrio sp.]